VKPIEVKINPGLMKVGNKTYAIAGDWIEVPNGTTLETLSQYVVKKRYQPPNIKEYSALGSKGAKYKVVHNLDKDVWSCDCSAFKYRRMVCKHIKGINADANR
jgi:hypothetical protein